MLLRPNNEKDYSSRVIDDHKYLTIHNSVVRLDTIKISSDSGGLVLNRSTHFGDTNGIMCSLTDFIFSQTDLITGDLKIIESSVTNNYINKRVIGLPNNYIDPMSDCLSMGAFNMPIYRLDGLMDFNIRKTEIRDNISLPLITDKFEDQFNLEFSKAIGNIASVATSATLSLPFRCDIIVDTDMKGSFNIKNIKLLYKGIVEDSVYKDIVYKFSKSISYICNRFSDYCNKEKRSIRMYISVREFDTYITLIDKQLKSEFKMHLNNSDHLRAGLTAMSHLGSKFMNKESFGDLIESECITTMPSIFLTEYSRMNFEYCEEADNYTITVKE